MGALESILPRVENQTLQARMQSNTRETTQDAEKR
jgi:hypothetical protein